MGGLQLMYEHIITGNKQTADKAYNEAKMGTT